MRSRCQRVSLGRRVDVPEKISEYTPWFTNVSEGGDFLERYRSKEFQLPSFWRLPQSVTSLTVTANKVALPKTRDIVARLPNSDDLSLLGPHKAVAERALPGIGATLRGRFGEQLRLVGPGARWRTCHGHVIRGPSWVTFHRGAGSQYA